jgi:hypothetical protein
MSRRVWIVLLVVVAVLAIAPHLPEWWPALVGAIRDFDLTATERGIVAMSNHGIALLSQGVALARARPQPLLGATAGVALSLLIVGARRMLRRQTRMAERATPAITVMPSKAVPPVMPVVAPAVSRPTHAQERAALAPTTLRVSEPARASLRRSATPGRGTMVRRLSAAGHSTAEIARATHVGQDAVRLVLLRGAVP